MTCHHGWQLTQLAVVVSCHCRLRQLVAEGRVDELQAELDKFKQGPADLRTHLEKVCMTPSCTAVQRHMRVFMG